MKITRKDALYPNSYTASAPRFSVVRHDELKETLVRVVIGKRHEDVGLWLNDEELDALATMLRDAHDTSLPLFTTTEAQEAA